MYIYIVTDLAILVVRILIDFDIGKKSIHGSWKILTSKIRCSNMENRTFSLIAAYLSAVITAAISKP